MTHAETMASRKAQADEREALAAVIVARYSSFDPISAAGIADAVLAAGYRRSPGPDLLAEVERRIEAQVRDADGAARHFYDMEREAAAEKAELQKAAYEHALRIVRQVRAGEDNEADERSQKG